MFHTGRTRGHGRPEHETQCLLRDLKASGGDPASLAGFAPAKTAQAAGSEVSVLTDESTMTCFRRLIRQHAHFAPSVTPGKQRSSSPRVALREHRVNVA